MAGSGFRTRLCLVTPPQAGRHVPDALREAIGAGDVATLLIDPASGATETLAELAAIAMDRGVAAVFVGAEPPARADGVQVETGVEDLRAARKRVGENGIVGAGGVHSRHDAMTMGEALPDYLFFGRIDGDDAPAIHPKAFELANWWSELFEIPAVVMGGAEVGSVGAAATAGIEFVALRRAVWNHPDSPGEAVVSANRELELKQRS